MPLIFDPTGLNSISNVFQEPHDFLIFTDWVNIYISSRSSQPKLPSKKDWRTFSWSGERRCIDKFLKITEWDLAYLLNTFGDHSLRVFVTGKASLVLIKKKNLKFEWNNFDVQYSYNKYCLAFVSCMSPFNLNHALNNKKSN